MTPGQRWILIVVGVALLAFGLGAGWQYMRATDAEQELESVRHSLDFARMQNTLAHATLEVQRGRHELARQLASSFFTELQARIESAPEETRAALSDVLARRDAAITSLSRAEPEAASLMAELFVRYRLAFGEAIGAASTAADTTPVVPADTTAPAVPVVPPDTTEPVDTGAARDTATGDGAGPVQPRS